MDNLEDVPLNNSELSAKEKAILEEYFPQSKKDEESSSSTSSSFFGRHIIYYIVVFVVLSNPWIDSLLTKIPYCPDNKIALLVLKTLLFVVCIFIIQKFL
jgi:hypothetical protein